MKLRSSKAAGSFTCDKRGSFELLINIEADPATSSFCEFSFEAELLPFEARFLNDLPAYLLRHEAGLFVVCAEPYLARRPPRAREIWNQLDYSLARKGIWLFAVEPAELRREPAWSNALELARCSQVDVDPQDVDRVQEHLGRVGRSSIREVMKLCRASEDSFDAILKLVASGILVCDDDFELSPCSRVRRARPSARTTAIAWL